MQTNYYIKPNYYATPTGYTSYEEYRNYDERACEVVNDFLDENFYPHFTVDTTFERIETMEEQVKGIDCTFTATNGIEYICDEKAAVKWANKNLKTFAIELNYINRAGNLHMGWFLDDKNVSNSYNFIYTDKIRDDEGDFNYHTFTEDNIKEVTCILVSKDKLTDYFNSLGWTKKRFLIKCQKIRESNGECKMGDLETNGLRFHYGKNLPEKSINALVSREKLKEIADYVYTYKNGKVDFLKKGG